jgi:peptide-methionine (S)-S-oxide reductase
MAPGTRYSLSTLYHQKYLLKRRMDLMRAISGIYPEKQAFMDSTAMARLNGYAGGYGSPQQLAREIDRLGLGLGQGARKALIALVDGNTARETR